VVPTYAGGEVVSGAGIVPAAIAWPPYNRAMMKLIGYLVCVLLLVGGCASGSGGGGSHAVPTADDSVSGGNGGGHYEVPPE